VIYRIYAKASCARKICKYIYSSETYIGYRYIEYMQIESVNVKYADMYIFIRNKYYQIKFFVATYTSGPSSEVYSLSDNAYAPGGPCRRKVTISSRDALVLVATIDNMKDSTLASLSEMAASHTSSLGLILAKDATSFSIFIR